VLEIKRKIGTAYLRLSSVDFRNLSVLYSYQKCVCLLKFVVASVGLCVTGHCLKHLATRKYKQLKDNNKIKASDVRFLSRTL
jgi:hypothetical protein